MNITWLGHSGFRIEIEEAVLLIDPWLTATRCSRPTAGPRRCEGATHILLTHGHGDHAGERCRDLQGTEHPAGRHLRPALVSCARRGRGHRLQQGRHGRPWAARR